MATARARRYPYLIALVFPLNLMLSNVRELPGLTAALMVFGFVLLMTAAVDLVGRFLVRDPDRRALMVSIVMMFMLGYGHIDAGVFHENVFSSVLMPSLVFGVVLPLLWIVWRVRNPERIVSVAHTIALALVGVQVATALPSLIIQSVQAAEELASSKPVVETRGIDPVTGVKKPDVYLMVFDAYARADMLKQYNQLDNTEFLDALKTRGFYVSDKARSNYMYTRLSLSSFLNMKYLDDQIKTFGDNPPRGAINPMLREFEVARRFKQLGYTYRHIGGYWHVTRQSPIADENVSYLPSFIEEFAFVFLEGTALHPFLKAVPGYGEWFQPGVIHMQQLKAIAKPQGEPGPVFTFAHVLAPHSPYVFDRHGIKGADTSLTKFERPLEYAEQVRYLNQQILKIVDEIDRVSGKDAIILVHGDHGARSQGQLGGTPDQNREQMATFAAYRVPDETRAALYPGMSLVNNWRVIFSTAFGAKDLPLLPDRTFYSDPDRIYDLEEIDVAGNFLHARLPQSRAATSRTSGGGDE
jgi:hypothetical protein